MAKVFPTNTGLALDCWQCRSAQTNWEEAALSHEALPAAPRSRSVYHLAWQRILPPPLLQMRHKNNPANFSLTMLCKKDTHQDKTGTLPHDNGIPPLLH